MDLKILQMVSHKLNATFDAAEVASKEDCSICMDEKVDSCIFSPCLQAFC